MKKIYTILFLLCVYINVYSITYNTIEEIKPQQLYTTTEIQFGNQERINIQNDYPLSYGPSFGISPQAIGDTESGSVTVDGVTVTWTVKAGFIGWIWWTITYSDGTTESAPLGSFEDAKKYAQEQARKKAEEIAKSLAAPIGGAGVLLSICAGYAIFKRRKQISISKNR